MTRSGGSVLSRREALGLAGVGTVGVAAAAVGGWSHTRRSQRPQDPVRAAPWAQRPVVSLAFDVASDLRSVTGRETVLFTPDAPVTELVFRAWPNTPAGARAGNHLEVTDATVDGVAVTPVVRAAGAPAGAPGTLVELPLPAGSAPAGRTIRAGLDFRLGLGAETGERTGSSPTTTTAWFGTAYPLLAWVRGQGWARDDAVDLAGETVTSEDFRLADLTVTADAGLRILGAGSDAGAAPAPPGRVARRFTADAVRDVAVAVGDYDVTEAQAGPVRLHVGTPRSGTTVDGGAWADEIADRIARLTELLGPFPYPDLWATIVPTQTDGVEFPTSIQLGDLPSGRLGPLVAHELAHQWFYSLIGNDQARDPWLDESFATFAQAIAADQVNVYRQGDVRVRDRGLVGAPMTFWASTGRFDRYVAGVYSEGAAALLAARRRAGPDRFDPALRAYIAANAHRVVVPGDVRAAFAEVPEVIEALTDAGALPAAPGPAPRPDTAPSTVDRRNG